MKKTILFTVFLMLLAIFTGCQSNINVPPSKPELIKPEINSEIRSVNPVLNWSCKDPNGDRLTYDVYFGKSALLTEPSLRDHILCSFSPDTLDYDTRYYWKIVAKDGKGGESRGEVWSFKTTPEPVIVRVMSYNIRHGLGMDDNIDLNRTISVIQEASPDILILNEVDQGQWRTLFQMQAKEIAEALTMKYFFSPTEGTTNYGNAVLSKMPIKDSFGVDLPVVEEGIRERGAAVIITTAGTKEIMVIGTHLGLGGSAQLKAELNAVHDIYKNHDYPTIIGGDFNKIFSQISTTDPALTRDLKSVNNEIGLNLKTYPADAPKKQIDYILASSEFQTEGASVKSSQASDHLPIITELELYTSD